MRNSRMFDAVLLQRIAGILLLAFLSTGCADMIRQEKPELPPPARPGAIRTGAIRTETLSLGDHITHRVRSGETLSGIAMAYYDTYLTDVYYHLSRGQFMTQEAGRPYPEDALRRMGKVSDVIARLNELDSFKLKVGGDIVLPRILGLPFRKEKPQPEKPPATAISAGKAAEAAEAAEPPPEKRKTEDTDAAFRKLLGEGRRYFERKGYAAAIVPFSWAYRLKPQNPVVREYLHESYAALGEAAFAEKDYLRAVKAFEAALQYDAACTECRQKKAAGEERYKDLHYKKGIRYFEDEQLEQAIAEWERVREIDPDYQNVAKNIELARRLLKRLGEMEKE